MPRATIVFEDGPDGSGTFKVDTDYEGGFQVNSHAHQHAHHGTIRVGVHRDV